MPYTPTTIINTGSSPVAITLTGITYNQFLNSLGAYVYQFNELYLFTDVAAQLSNPIGYTNKDANGNTKTWIIQPVVDPYQYSPALYVPLEGRDIIIDDSATIEFNLLPNATLKLQFFGKSISVTQYLGGDTNFSSVAESLGMDDFFVSQDQIED